MGRIVLRDRPGFTLVEVMVSFVIILITMLGLLQLTAQITAENVRNIIRDEGVRVAEEILTQWRALPYDQIVTPAVQPLGVQRNLRNFSVLYNPNIQITTYSGAKIINVTVTWQYRGVNYSHSISSLVRIKS